MHRPHAVITGGSSGIGLELARLFAGHDYDLTLVARDPVRLDEAASTLAAAHHVEVRARVADLSRPEEARALVATLQEGGGSIDVLVNNAGFGLYAPFLECDPDEMLEMVALNVGGLTLLTRLMLPRMRERGAGRILNVASMAAFQPGPYMAAYYATKAYVLSFSEALGEEMRGTGVTVTALCPGPTLSGFQARSGMGRSKLLHGFPPTTDARMVAEQGFDGLMRGRAVVIPGVVNRMLAFSGRLLPRAWVTRISGWLAAPHGR